MNFKLKLNNLMRTLLLVVFFYSCNNFSNLDSKKEFDIAQSLLNDSQNYELAITYFKNIFKTYPYSEEAKKSLFMIGYIYNNNLHAYSDAYNYYNIFIEKYPDDDLHASVKYELESLFPIINQIDSLATVND